MSTGKVNASVKEVKWRWDGGNLLSFLLRCGTRPCEGGHPMRLELTRVGLLVELANHYTTRSALEVGWWFFYRKPH